MFTKLAGTISREENRLRGILIAAGVIATAYMIGRMLPERPALAFLFPLYAIAVYFLLFKPIVILIAVVLLTSTVFTLDAFPQPISVGKIGLYLPEVLVLLLWMRTLPVLLLKNDFKKLASPVTLPVVLFGIWIVFAVINATISQKSTFFESILIGRGYIYYFNFFLILYYLNSRQKVNLFLGVLTAAAAVCSILSFAQYVVGPEAKIFPWDSWNISRVTWDEKVPTLARVMPNSIALIYIFFFPVLSNKIAGTMKKNLVLTLFVIIAFLALFLSFTRNVYYSVIIGVFILWLNYKGKIGSRNIRSFVTILLVAGVIAYLPVYLGFVKVPNWWEQVTGRQEEFIEAGAKTESLVWRATEMLQVIHEIAKSPLIGNGIGATYYHPFYRTYVAICHNGYVSIVFQMGIIGLLILFFLLYRFFSSGLKYYRTTQNEYFRNTIFGFVAAMFALLPAIWVKPVLVEEYFWISLLGIVWALPAIIARNDDSERKELP